MSTITTRAGKGSPLTNNEVDANFTNLNTDKAEAGANSDITALSAIAGGIASPDYVDFDTAATGIARATGRLTWNSTDGTLELGLLGSDVTLQIGQEIVTRSYNANGSLISNGNVVYFFSAAGGVPAVKKFISDRTVDPELVIGVATESFNAGSYGYVTEFGVVRGLNTSSFSVGDILYASPFIAGAITNERPITPNAVVKVGICLDVDTVDGSILVNPHKVPDADEIFYDSTESGLTASNVKGAIDELQLNKADVSLLQANINLFATTAASDIATYNKLVTSVTDEDFDDPAVDVSTGDLSTSETLIASLASEAGIIEGDLAGITVTTIGNVRQASGNDPARFWFEVYHRASDDTETLIGTGNKTEYNEPETYTQFFDSALLSSQVFTSTDRIVLKFYGQIDGAGTSEYEFQFGGDQPVRTLFPVPASLIPTTAVAGSITTDTGSFNGILSGSDTTVQAALDTIDDHTHLLADVTDVTATAAELNKLDGVTATTAELNYLDITTLGTTEASKAVTADANGVVTFDNGVVEDSTALSGTSVTINLRDGNNFTHSLSGNTTYTFSNPGASGRASAFTLKVVQDSSDRTITWPASVDWAAATAPTLSSGSGAVDYFVFITTDGGTNYYGFTAGQALG